MAYFDVTKNSDEDIEREFKRNFRKIFGNEFDGIGTYSAIKICKDNLDVLLYVVWESGLGYGDESDFNEKRDMISAFESIKTVKGFKEWFKKFEISEWYYLRIYKGYLVDYFPK